jgi:hypothetical protein
LVIDLTFYQTIRKLGHCPNILLIPFKTMIRLILLALSVAVASGLLFVNVYTSIVDAPNWGADLPNSILAARQYFSVAHPGTFFRIVSPLNQLLAVTALILCWKRNRYIAIGLLAVTILADVFTFGYFYPRNEILFVGPVDTDAIRLAWEQWSTMNWVRSALCAVNVVLAFILLISTAKKSAL